MFVRIFKLIMINLDQSIFAVITGRSTPIIANIETLNFGTIFKLGKIISFCISEVLNTANVPHFFESLSLGYFGNNFQSSLSHSL